jgi:CheY-like chemotaxis protein
MSSKPVILIADDEAVVRTMIHRYFTALGYDVVQADSGEKAVQYAQTVAPSLILMDVYMPGIGGLKSLKMLRDNGSSCPIIVLTALSDESIARIALENGATDYLTKPIDLLTLRKAVETHLSLTPLG